MKDILQTMMNMAVRGSIISQLHEEALDFLLRSGRVYEFKRNSVIFLESEQADRFFLILEGSVKISRLNREGKEVVIAILGKGNFFGEMALLDGFGRSADASAEENTSILSIREDVFNQLLYDYPDVTIRILRELARRIRNSDSQIKGLSLLNSRGKVASALLRWAHDQGIAQGEDVVITGAPTQKEMASYVGLTRETFNRVLKKLESEGYIEIYPRGCFRINDFERFRSIFGPFF